MSPMVTIFVLVLIVLPLSIYSAYLLYVMLKNTDSGKKYILFGIQVSLIGGIVVLDNNIDLNGFEYIIVIIGLILSMVGMSKDK